MLTVPKDIYSVLCFSLPRSQVSEGTVVGRVVRTLGAGGPEVAPFCY